MLVGQGGGLMAGHVVARVSCRSDHKPVGSWKGVGVLHLRVVVVVLEF